LYVCSKYLNNCDRHDINDIKQQGANNSRDAYNSRNTRNVGKTCQRKDLNGKAATAGTPARAGTPATAGTPGTKQQQ
jgi:hypothetical protein